jgi:LPXTG-motif cell wall-anchored protein
VAAALLVLVLAAGCRVQTTVSIEATSATAGTVTVTVALDRAAVQALGGQAALASDLSTKDLMAAGWIVDGPRPGPGSETLISAEHGFSSVDEANALVADVAGTGPASKRPFRVTLGHHHDFWHTYTTLSGAIDLRCQLECFGDSGLRSALGSPTGEDPAALGSPPAQVFSFTFDGRLPGALRSANGARLPDGVVRWSPALGRATEVSAQSETVNTGSVVLVAVLSGLAVALVVGLLIWWLVRRRRKHRKMREDRERLAAAVTSPSS